MIEGYSVRMSIFRFLPALFLLPIAGCDSPESGDGGSAAVFVIEVRDGRVTRQWDFVDYSVGPTG